MCLNLCLHLCLFLQSGMALAYDPTAMQNGYVIMFFSYLQITTFKKKKKHPYFTFELNSLANICGA